MGAIDNNGHHSYLSMVTIRNYSHLLIAAGRLPVGGHQRGQVVLVAHRGQAAEHVSQIRQRVFAAMPLSA
jgi:hypothetical protein